MNSFTQGHADSGYISSNRVAQLSGYTQDYIGQLCRDGRVDCRRLAGEWQVRLSSVQAYKARFNPSTTPVRNTQETLPPVASAPTGTALSHEDGVDHNGVHYIASSTAMKLTGYTQDYIGQLARSGAVEAHKVGRKWFVSKEALLAHKSHNDSLLAAVQAQSAGSSRGSDDHTEAPAAVIAPLSTSTIHKVPIIRYQRDDGLLLPGVEVESGQPSIPYSPIIATPPTSVKHHRDLRIQRADTIRKMALQRDSSPVSPHIEESHSLGNKLSVNYGKKEDVGPKEVRGQSAALGGNLIAASVAALACVWIMFVYLQPVQATLYARGILQTVGGTAVGSAPLGEKGVLSTLLSWSVGSEYYTQSTR